MCNTAARAGKNRADPHPGSRSLTTPRNRPGRNPASAPAGPRAPFDRSATEGQVTAGQGERPAAG